MCYSDEARPPLPPVRGGATAFGELTLTSADGTSFGAYYAHPDTAQGAGMVILPDVRGLHPFYKELARRVAETGLSAVAIDYFGRSADDLDRSESFPWAEHVAKLQPDHVRDDVAAAVDWLRSRPGAGVHSVFTMGFCLGGAMSWRQSAAGAGLAGCIGFYGVPARAADCIGSMEAPLLILAAGNDDFVERDDVERFAAAARNAGTEVTLRVYDGAPHSFFDHNAADFAEACDDAWRRVLDFVAAHR